MKLTIKRVIKEYFRNSLLKSIPNQQNKLSITNCWLFDMSWFSPIFNYHGMAQRTVHIKLRLVFAYVKNFLNMHKFSPSLAHFLVFVRCPKNGYKKVEKFSVTSYMDFSLEYLIDFLVIQSNLLVTGEIFGPFNRKSL
jgi:hypothetical protein